jgi:hypothetical protein
MARGRTSKATASRRRQSTHPAQKGPSSSAGGIPPFPAFASKREKPRTVDHFCKRTQQIRRGDERDCRICLAKVCPEPAEVEAARREERDANRYLPGSPGALAEMSNRDLNGRPWGHKANYQSPGVSFKDGKVVR